jgi:hypothetical protein
MNSGRLPVFQNGNVRRQTCQRSTGVLPDRGQLPEERPNLTFGYLLTKAASSTNLAIRWEFSYSRFQREMFKCRCMQMLWYLSSSPFKESRYQPFRHHHRCIVIAIVCRRLVMRFFRLLKR